MNRQECCDRLNKMYSDKYYNGINNECIFFEKCRGNVTLPDCKFNFDRANVGKEYGNDETLPKIVVVGLEGLGKEGIVDDIDEPSDTAFNSHYKGVRYVLAYILSAFTYKDQPENALKKTLSNYNDTTHEYTLLNCYKCALEKKAQGLTHTECMRENCQKILFDEIKILNPDFLVIQIKSNRPTEFETNIRTELGNGNDLICIAGDESTGAYKIITPSGKPIILIWTYHGSGDPDPNKRSWSNDNKNGNTYIENILKPVLNAAIKEFKNNK